MYKMLAMLGENGFQTQAKIPSSQEKGVRFTTKFSTSRKRYSLWEGKTARKDAMLWSVSVWGIPSALMFLCFHERGGRGETVPAAHQGVIPDEHHASASTQVSMFPSWQACEYSK